MNKMDAKWPKRASKMYVGRWKKKLDVGKREAIGRERRPKG